MVKMSDNGDDNMLDLETIHLVTMTSRINEDFEEMCPYTPREMAEMILKKMGDISSKSILVLYTLEMAIVLKGIGCSDVVVATNKECELTKCLASDMEYQYMLMNEVETEKMKFKVVMGNPPYQEAHNSGNAIWPQFVERGLNLLEDDGLLAMIHPPTWRGAGPTNNSSLISLRGKLKALDMEWLSIHDDNDGDKTFKKKTPYDAYIAHNANTARYATKEIVDVRGKTVKNFCIKDIGLEFIPNFGFKDDMLPLLKDLIATEGEKRVDLLYSASDYETRKPWMSKRKTKKFKHPCIYSISKKDGKLKRHWSSINNKGSRSHFGTPKVIFGKSQRAGIPYADVNGEYGLTEFVAAVVDRSTNLPRIADAMNSEKFREVMRAVRFSSEDYNRHVISLFRRDFWKGFV